VSSSDAQQHPPQPRRGWTLHVGLAGAAVAVSLVAAGSLVGVAALTGSLVWSTLGAVTAAVMLCLALWLVLRRLACLRGPSVVGSWIRRPVGLLILLAAAALLSLTWLLPGSVTTHGNSGPAGSVDRIEWLVRPDGSRLAVHLTRASAATKPPLVVVHGGPGVADMAHDAPAFASLATDRNVYIYDRVGTGASTRLADPLQYTIGRAVQDLEALRIKIGAAQIALHSHSWGARIAVAYAQDHPDRVSALVLSAPGDLPVDGGVMTPGDLTTRLDAGQKARLYVRLFRPRNLFTYALTAADARVAHQVAGDREMDARFAAIYHDSTPALFCEERLAERVGTNGLGYYAHYIPQLHADPADEPVDLDRLARVTAPVLVIKPACDYVPWSTAGYRRAFPQSRLVMIPDAGHVAYLEQPELYLQTVDAFLHDRALPLPTRDGATVPPDYRGTP
jgi:proline iminopeptidase